MIFLCCVGVFWPDLSGFTTDFHACII